MEEEQSGGTTAAEEDDDVGRHQYWGRKFVGEIERSGGDEIGTGRESALEAHLSLSHDVTGAREDRQGRLRESALEAPLTVSRCHRSWGRSAREIERISVGSTSLRLSSSYDVTNASEDGQGRLRESTMEGEEERREGSKIGNNDKSTHRRWHERHHQCWGRKS